MVIQTKLFVGKMKDKTTGVVIEEFVRLRQKMYLNLVDNSSNNTEYIKTKMLLQINHN